MLIISNNRAILNTEQMEFLYIDEPITEDGKYRIIIKTAHTHYKMGEYKKIETCKEILKDIMKKAELKSGAYYMPDEE